MTLRQLRGRTHRYTVPIEAPQGPLMNIPRTTVNRFSRACRGPLLSVLSQ